jgi:hypothetical protein
MQMRLVFPLMMIVGMCFSTGVVVASSLRDALIPPRARGSLLEPSLRPLANAIGSQVANQIPTLSTSAGYTYEYNPTLETLERSAKTYGPLFTERAVTIGKGHFNVNASYSWIHFDNYNGKSLNHLTSRVEDAIPAGEDGSLGTVFAGIRNQDGFLTQLRLKLNLEAQLFDFSFTYGVLDDLDVNLDVPVLLTYARSGITDTIPDPRCLNRGHQECEDVFNGLSDPPPNGFLGDDGFYRVPESSARDNSLGIGDIHFRTKYRALRDPLNLAGLLDLGVPTGDVADFQGTGDTTLRTMLIVSRDIVDGLEVHSQAGVELTINDVDRSQARYGIGFTGQPFAFAAFTVDFLGRSEFNPQGRIKDTGRLPAVKGDHYEQTFDELNDPNAVYTGRPFFIDVKRNDVLDLAVGMKLSVNERTIVFANFLVPLNDDGLRSDFVPTIGGEISF